MSYLDKPWLKSYKLGPYKLEESLAPYPKEPVFKALDDAAEKYPGQTAIQFIDRSLKEPPIKNPGRQTCCRSRWTGGAER